MASGGAGKVRSKIDPGTVFGSYKYLGEKGFDRSKSPVNQRRVEVECISCEALLEVGYDQLKRNKGNGCRSCSAKARASKTGDIYKTFFGRLRKSSSARGKDFEITADYLDSVFSGQWKKCIYSGVDLEIGRSDKSGNASVDRIDSSKGYVEDNVQFTHKVVNMMKQEMDEDRFLFLVSQISRDSMSKVFPIGFTVPCPERRGNYRGFKNISGEFLGHIKYRAKKQGFEMNIDAEYLYSLLEKQEWRCAYSGIGLIPKVYGSGENRTSTGTLSVDRIDSSRGYVRGNVQLVLIDVNFMKGSLDHDEFLDWVDRIYQWVFVSHNHFKQIDCLTDKFYGKEVIDG